MNFILLLPFAYFWTTRLSKGSLAFHALFEWLPAILVVVALGSSRPRQDLLGAFLSYAAFISVYELGYIANDLLVARKEEGGRERGPQTPGRVWIGSWVATRLGVFGLCTLAFDQSGNPAWWLFFMALGLVFTLHNWLDDRELKVATFTWLAWFRFMAPVMFVVQDMQRMGIGLAAALGYVAFRQLGYLDSKGLLNMPGRQRSGFRRLFFLMPLAGAAALLPYDEARGFVLVSACWGLLATLGTLVKRSAGDG